MKSLKSTSIVLILFALVMVGCSDSGRSSGSLSLKMTDAATTLYQGVYVTVSGVEVYDASAQDGNGEWITVASPNKTYNLLELVNGATVSLGLDTIPVGEYDQMRLIIGQSPDNQEHPYANYVLDEFGKIHELKIPSGLTSGIKISTSAPFSVQTGETTELLLDFNALKSVVTAGKNGQWFLKPSVKALNVETMGVISGVVKDEETGVALQGVEVSVQVPDAETPEAMVVASTVTDADGAYKVYTEPGDYTLVSVSEDYQVAVSDVSVASGQEVTNNVISEPSDQTGAVQGEVTVLTETVVASTETTVQPSEVVTDKAVSGSVTGAVSETTTTTSEPAADASVMLSFRQTVQNESGEKTTVEVGSLNIANGGQYSINLPAGVYSVLAQMPSGEELKFQLTVTSDATTTLNIDGEQPSTESQAGTDTQTSTSGTDSTAVTQPSTSETQTSTDTQTSTSGTDSTTVTQPSTSETQTSTGTQTSTSGTDSTTATQPSTSGTQTTTSETTTGTTTGDDDKKVTICHNGHLITVSSSALDAHLGHGDSVGECGTSSSTGSESSTGTSSTTASSGSTTTGTSSSASTGSVSSTTSSTGTASTSSETSVSSSSTTSTSSGSLGGTVSSTDDSNSSGKGNDKGSKKE